MKLMLSAVAAIVMVSTVHGWIRPQDPAALVEKLKSADADEAENARRDLLALGEKALPALRDAAAKAEKEDLKKTLAQLVGRLELRKAVAEARWEERWYSIYGGTVHVGWANLKTEAKDGKLVLTDEIHVQPDKNNAASIKSSVTCLPDERFSMQDVSIDINTPDRQFSQTARVKDGRLVAKDGEGKTHAIKLKADTIVDTAVLRLVTVLPDVELDLTVLQLLGQKPKFLDSAVLKFDKEESIELNGRNVKCRRFILADGENDRIYYVDAERRLVKIQLRSDEKDIEILLSDEAKAKDIDTKE